LRQALSHEGGVGATDFEAALTAATTALAGADPDSAMIVYLGDGMITSGARNLDALRTELAGKAHFVGVGVGDGPDTQTLDALAAATGGYATTFDLSDDLGWRAFDLVAATISALFPDALPAAYVMTGATDSRHFTRICDHVYRFAPFRMDAAQRHAVHSYDEHLGVEAFLAGIDWYQALIEGLPQ